MGWNQYYEPSQEEKDLLFKQFLKGYKNKSAKWDEIPGFANYKVSTAGDIYSSYKNNLLKPKKDKDGYLEACLYNKGKTKYKRVHRIVMETFTPKDTHKKEVNHKDFNVANNNLENLEWVSSKENINYSRHNNRYPSTAGENNPRAKLTAEDVKYIRKHFTYASQYDLAKKFNVSNKTIQNVAYRLAYKNIN